ncbi:MAG: hypothetical protein B7Z83_01035 [Thiomonas sp. 20-64-5]|nr:MAG: hypothetical protein B7Z83_01035 [Thiomonas sp. 20-64-5]
MNTCASPAPVGWIARLVDAAAGLPFRIRNRVDCIVTCARGHRTAQLDFRTLADWRHALQALGFNVQSMPRSQGAPFSNVSLVASVATVKPAA